jgi:hypothetical protein
MSVSGWSESKLNLPRSLKGYNDMKSIDLEKYKSAWKSEKSFGEEKLTEKEIAAFLKSSSKSIHSFFRNNLITDGMVKTLLIISFPVLSLFVPNQVFLSPLNLLLWILAAGGMAWQYYILRKIPRRQQNLLSVIQQLEEYIHYYYKYYTSSIYVGALSATLFFLMGSVIYLRFKYQELPSFQTDDFLVLSLGILLSYGISATVQFFNSNFRIRQLEKCLLEIEENTIQPSRIIKNLFNRKRLTLVFGVAMIVGLLLLLFLILA